MNELEPVAARINEDAAFLVPITGELVDLTQPKQVAHALETVRDAKRLLDEARQLLEGALVLEAKRQGTKTLHLDGLDIEIGGGTKVEWDADRLAELLRIAGLPEQRISQVVVETVTYKVNALEAKRVAGANADYADIVAACRRDVPAAYHAYIKR